MSWDLLVAIHDRPIGFGSDESLPGNYTASGALEESSSNLLVSRLASGRESPAFTIDGPARVEVEDLPEALAGAVLSPRFLLEVSVPASAIEADRALARKIATQLAKQFRGAVYDPQRDELVWPKARSRTYSASGEKERIRLVELAWYVTGGSDDLAARWLEGSRTACPEAHPRRYGDYEPLQHKLEPGDEDDFVAFWQRLAANELGTMFFWKSQSPCFGGTVSFPDKRDAYPSGEPVGIPGTRRCTQLSLTFDGRALHADARWSEAVVGLFTSMAKRLNAFYAVGCVKRDVIAKRGLWFDGQSESLPLPFSFFGGLAPVPTWLAWFGRPYAEHVAESCRESAKRTPDGSWFFQGGPHPMDADELAGRFPALPSELIFETRPDAPAGSPRIIAAALIPPL